MAIQGVIFDLDGTLVDTLPDISDAVNVGLAAYGLPPAPAADVRQWIGEGLPTLCRRAAQGADVPIDEMAAIVTRHYAVHRLDKSAPYPGVPELLDELVGRGVAIAVLSNKPHLHTAPMTEALLGRWPWIAVEGYREEARRKPDPRTALEIVATMSAEPDRVMLVGDSDTDMITARNAGLIPVGVTWGYRDRALILGAGARHLVDHPRGLLALL